MELSSHLSKHEKIKLNFKLILELVPGCRGNYVPLGFKPTCSHSHPLWNYWPLGPYQQNKFYSISSPPRDANSCDAAQVWGGPRATEHTKMPPYEEAGLLTNYLFPKPREVVAYGLYGPAQAKQIKVERDKRTLTVRSGC